MKKILLILCFCLLAGSVVFASLDSKKAELQKVGAGLVKIGKEINAARAARQINKVAELKEVKRGLLAKADKLKKEISKLESTGGNSTMSGPGGKKIQWQGGYGGGAGLIGAGLVVPMPAANLVIGANLGLGNGYTVLVGGIAAQLPAGLGLDLNLVNYSQTVTDIPGLSGNISSGGRLGLGIFFCKAVANLKAKIGYNSALGLTLGISN